jgi:peptidoglycan/LPS O-acetylase OafA/YrhL
VIFPRHRRVTGLMALLAASLAVTSALHLSGAVQGRDNQVFSPLGAGVAEAVIGVALLWGAVSLVRGTRQGERIALGTTGFAIAGFGYGLSVSVRGGALPDICYHATVLPVLIVTLVLILRARRRPRAGASQAPRQARRAA